MELHHQTIYLFIDPNLRKAYGYTECTTEGVCELTFKVGKLKIQSVHVNDDPVQYKIKTDAHIIDENERTIGQGLYAKLIDHKNTLSVRTAHAMNTVRVQFVPNVQFYERLPGDHKHAEVIGVNGECVLFPYLDGMAEYTLVYVVPPDFTVVSPGQLVGVIEHCECIVHTYAVRTFAENVCFAVGTYEAYEISAVKTLYMPRYAAYADLKNDLNAAHRFVNAFVGGEHALPLSLVFTMVPCTAVALHVALQPLSTFPSADDIALNFAFKERVARLIGTQLFINTYFEREDLWLRQGLIGYVADHILKHMLGTNEFLFRLRNAIDAIVRVDHLHLPLYAPARSAYSYRSAFVRKKAAVFMHILENNTSLAFMQKIVKICLSAQRINTHAFIGTVRDVTGKDLRSERMIYRNNSGTYTGELSIDLKKNQVHVVFNGPVNTVVQSHEVEGVYEHVVKRELTYAYHNRRKKDDESVLFVRVDPYITQLSTYKLVLKGTMYVNLTRDKNVLSQMEGIRHVDEGELERLVYDVHTNYRVKLMAMHYLGINSILSFFVKKFCVQGSTIIRPNAFSVLNHEVLVGTMRVLSQFDPYVKRVVNEKVVSVGAILKAFFYNVLRYNDNSSNAYDDSVFVGQLIRGLSFMLTVRSNDREVGAVVREGVVVGEGVVEGMVENKEGVVRIEEGAIRDEGVVEEIDRVKDFNDEDNNDNERNERNDDNSNDDNRKDNNRKDNNERNDNLNNNLNNDEQNTTVNSRTDDLRNKNDDNVRDNDDDKDSTIKDDDKDSTIKDNDKDINPTNINKDINPTNTNSNINTNNPLNPNLNTNLNECDDIYVEIIERYRMKDIIFPSNCNRVTCAVLYFYGRLDLYGMLSMNTQYLLTLIRPANFIAVRCAAAEILTFKTILDDDHAPTMHSTYVLLDTMLRMEDAIQTTVYKTISNLLTCTTYNALVKRRLCKSYFYDRLRCTESASLREHVLDVIYFLEGLDVEIRADEQLEHELSSTDEESVRVRVVPLVDLRVRLRVNGAYDGVFVRRIVPVKENDGVVKLRIGVRAGLDVPGKRIRINDEEDDGEGISSVERVVEDEGDGSGDEDEGVDEDSRDSVEGVDGRVRKINDGRVRKINNGSDRIRGINNEEICNEEIDNEEICNEEIDNEEIGNTTDSTTNITTKSPLNTKTNIPPTTPNSMNNKAHGLRGTNRNINRNDKARAKGDRTEKKKKITKNTTKDERMRHAAQANAKITDITRAAEHTGWCFTDNTMIRRIVDKYGDKMPFPTGITTEKELRAFLTHVFMSTGTNAPQYSLARTVYNELEHSKLLIPLLNRSYTPLSAAHKQNLKKLLSTLTIPQFTRPKNYKDITRRPKTVYSLKKKLDSIAVLEFFKLEIVDFLEKCTLFTSKRSFNENGLLAYLYALPESKHVSVYELLVQCFELIKTKRVCAEFVGEVRVDGYDAVIRTPMYVDLIVEKIRDGVYGCVLDVQKDVELIAANAALFNGEDSVYAADSKHLVKWFKRIVGGMLGDLYNDVD